MNDSNKLKTKYEVLTAIDFDLFVFYGHIVLIYHVVKALEIF